MYGTEYFDTHSQEVIVLEHIQSDRSNIFTIESWPPDARYLYANSIIYAIS